MNGNQFLETAHFLNSRTNEADYRSAISRAYYACFIATRDFVFGACVNVRLKKKANILNEQKIGHEKLRDYLSDSSNDAVKKLASDLASLYQSRIYADYHMKRNISVDNVNTALEEAEHFMNDLSKIEIHDLGRAMEDCLKKYYPDEQS